MIPLIAVAALTVPIVVDRVALAARAADTVRSVQVGGRIGSLVQDLQLERLLAVGHLVGAVDRSRLVLHEAAITDRIADIRADLGAGIGPELDAAVAAVDDLAETRAGVLARTADSDQVMTTYGNLIVRLIDALHLVDAADVATAEGRQIVAFDAALRLDDAISSGASHMLLVVAERSPQAATRYAMSLVSTQENAARFSRFASADQVALYTLVEQAVDERLGSGFTDDSRSGARDGFTVDPTEALAGLSVDALFPSLESLIALGRFVERKIVIDVTVEVTERQNQILLTAYGVAAAAGLVLLSVVALSLVVARSVAQPLARLTSSANRVARLAEAELVRVADDETERPDPVRLDPVEVTATDEIGDLARAFDRVQRTAARLVERQVSGRRNVAQMFGHVGRRTQNLVNRQLAVIDRLEREETDPKRLQHLYRLDHISSRLRRNAGSLVVLSGSTGAEEHMAPLPVSDVIRLALGEIEDYTRVDVQAPAGFAIVPSAIADLVLLLAEVMENGTVFSPPHTRVTVGAAARGDGLRISVVDSGLGLSAQRLAEENARLTHRERLDLVPTELLGLFVVGRLARRHGIAVALDATAGGGVTVTVDLGPELLVPTVASTPAPPRRMPPPGPVPARPSPVGTAPVRPAPATPQPDRPATRTSVGTVGDVGADPRFDPAALHRATTSLDTGTPWNAFGTAAPGSSGAPGGADSDQATGAAGPAGSVPAATEPAESAPAGRGPLRQRVPGAQHPVGTGPAAVSDTPTDPGAARALLEEFEAGVRRAQQQVARDPAAQDPQVAGSARLTQRVPGASLPDRPTAAPTASASWPPDPQAAKDSLDAFESGVQRALTEITGHPQHGKGPDR
ncbi:nitrate- and nitrite sensing domain-containing protein [Solwaraspora sp. WMMA2056]|uniref:nitrate- and nitrite sensing domain-containing protein n=1 Tax=Solwaraspora sp. WMMA2056 TaxID=3015161 RepID=UPI00259BC4DE|nr:nitrate- and nitrite sensing domain-containing protein [Solwaraspora sp. WMMA2056]WJK40321.1 nitrate- and nitrite sensing domain-containing protein [Solwaraspora sp. WMMA2056]